MKNHIWSQPEILNLLNTNNEFVKRSLIKLYDRQVSIEQVQKQSKFTNGVGFNKPDGYKLTSFAQFYLRNGYLSDKQIYVVRKRIVKYSAHITNIANSQ